MENKRRVMTAVHHAFVYAAAALLLAIAPASLVAQPGGSPKPVKVQDIYECGNSCVTQFVQVTGKVARWDEANSFVVEDDFGIGIRVVVVGPLPKREARVQIDGVVASDPAGNPYLTALKIVQPGAVAPTPTPPIVDSDRDGVLDTADRCPGTPVADKVDGQGCKLPFLPTETILLLGAGVAVIALGLLFAIRRPNAGAAPVVAGNAGQSSAGDPSIEDGKTIRVARPDESQGTLQILPGRLEIAAGPDAGRIADIRFMRDRTAAASVPEITFGRHGQASPTHVVIKSPTVSRLHAKFRFENGAWSVINFSETNPVLINKRPLSTTEAPVRLAADDMIEMGEVSFRYHSQ